MILPLITSGALGILSGSLSGLSLIRQGKGLHQSFFISILRIVSTTLLALILLRWGVITFILFVGSHIIAMWIAILTHNE